MPVRTPSSAAEALSVLDAGLDYLNATDVTLLGAAAQGECLRALGRANAKFTAAHAALVRAFDAAGGPEADGYPTPRAWLTARTRITKGAANEAVKWARTLARHPKLAAALAAEEISPSWAAKIAAWNDRLPEADIDGADEILLLAAAGGADLADLAALAQEIYERTVVPDDDDDSFGGRALWLDATFGGAGKVNGNLTPGCTAALQALMDALGKPRAPKTCVRKPSATMTR